MESERTRRSQNQLERRCQLIIHRTTEKTHHSRWTVIQHQGEPCTRFIQIRTHHRALASQHTLNNRWIIGRVNASRGHKGPEDSRLGRVWMRVHNNNGRRCVEGQPCLDGGGAMCCPHADCERWKRSGRGLKHGERSHWEGPRVLRNQNTRWILCKSRVAGLTPILRVPAQGLQGM